jgi:hypothetical protein
VAKSTNVHPVTTEQIVMIVKTYPMPSKTYGEIVCTAGIRVSDGTWVRIYPYPFRLVNKDFRFKKYETIELPVQKDNRDKRPESRRLVDALQIKSIAESIDTKNNWAQRMNLIRPTIISSVKEFLDGMLSDDKETWGPTIRPIPVASGSAQLITEFEGYEWPEEKKAKLDLAQERMGEDLFADPDLVRNFRQLRHLPYAFKLQFTDRTGDQYTLRILDWEIAQLYFKMRDQHGSDEIAIEKVRIKIEDQIFKPGNDVHLILGNMNHQYKNKQLAIDGIIYPKES